MSLSVNRGMRSTASAQLPLLGILNAKKEEERTALHRELHEDTKAYVEAALSIALQLPAAMPVSLL